MRVGQYASAPVGQYARARDVFRLRCKFGSGVTDG